MTVNEEILKKYNLTFGEFLLLLFWINGYAIGKCRESLIQKNLVEANLFDNESAVLSDNTKNLISDILIESNEQVIKESDNLEDIAREIRELYPKGRKPGTTYMWRDSVPMVARKLKTLVMKYDFKFTKQQAIEATKRYVESFQGDYRYMQLLKYFILKTDKQTGETKSDFMSYIENNDECNDNDWLNEII